MTDPDYETFLTVDRAGSGGPSIRQAWARDGDRTLSIGEIVPKRLATRFKRREALAVVRAHFAVAGDNDAPQAAHRV